MSSLRDLVDRLTMTYHPKDEFPGHHESVRGAYPGPDSPADFRADDFYIPEDASTPEHVKIDKSNLLLIGPTGVGKTYILECVTEGSRLACARTLG
jgi:ATP-dependent Clp protease ATP-binding subunit ClpX